MADCIICNLDNKKVWLEKNGYSLLRCVNCGLVYIDQSDLNEDISQINKDIYSDCEYNINYELKKEYFFKKSGKELDLIEKYILPGKVLDIGCSFGYFLKVAETRGWIVRGVELSEVTSKIAKDRYGLDVDSGRFEELRFKGEKFNLVTMWDSLEHFKKPVEVLGKVYSLLDKDGLLVLQLPNVESTMAKLAGKDWNWLLLPNHLYHFSPATIKLLLKKTGFEVIKLETLEPFEELLNSVKIHKQANLIVRGALRRIFFVVWKLNRLFGRGGLIKVYARPSYQ